jgi:16S rRNA (uracil1498-N3)-methyltransferase
LTDRSQNPTHTWPRLYVDSPLGAGTVLTLARDQAHYLVHVLRAKLETPIRLFNGQDGDWAAEIAHISKQSVELRALRLLCPQTAEPDVWLCCAPLKKQHFDDTLTKATELGVSRIIPILTERTQIREVNTARCRLLIKEAAEQAERLTLPQIDEALPLARLLAAWPSDRTLFLCAEAGSACPINEALTNSRLDYKAKHALFVGPEGGFSVAERDAVLKREEAVAVRLGPRILRADTAALAALACWQASCGDWPSTKGPVK